MPEPEPMLEYGERLKQEGQDRVMDNEHETWKRRVGQLLLSILNQQDTVTAQELRELAVKCDVPEPHHPNCWGAVFTRAHRAGLIRPLGMTKNALPSAHARTIGVWERAT